MHIARFGCCSDHPFTGSPARPISRRSKSCTWRAPVAVPLTRSPDLPFTRCSKRCTCCTSSVLWPSNSQKKIHIANTFRSANRKTHSKRCTWRASVAVPLTRSPDPPLARSHDAPKAARGAHRLPFRSPVRPISRSPDAPKDAHVALPPSYGHQTHRKRCTLRTLSVQRTARLTPKDAPGAHRLPFRSPVHPISRSPDAKKDARVELPPSYGQQTHRKRCTLRTLSVQRTARLTPKDAPGAHRLPFRSPVHP